MTRAVIELLRSGPNSFQTVVDVSRATNFDDSLFVLEQRRDVVGVELSRRPLKLGPRHGRRRRIQRGTTARAFEPGVGSDTVELIPSDKPIRAEPTSVNSERTAQHRSIG